MTNKLLVCIDGSVYADITCTHAAWAAERLGASVDVLHVLRRHSEYLAPADDHTGAIGLGARSDLLENLTKVDEERAQLDQKKGELILQHGKEFLEKAGVKGVNTVYRRGSLTETVKELEEQVDIIFLGKRGEHADTDSIFLGSNLEKVVRAVSKPVFVASSVLRPIERFLIAYDGKESVKKAVDYIASNNLLKGLECHLLAIEKNEGDIDTSESKAKLEKAGFKVIVKSEQSSQVDTTIASYVENHSINLLVTGAYSHTRILSILLGSTTASLVKLCKVPLLLFR